MRVSMVVVGVAIAAGAAFCAPGIAAADEQFDGQTYAEAQEALSEAGMTSRVGTVVGDALPTQQCTVTESRTEDQLGTSGPTGGTQVILDLDCNLPSAPDQQGAAGQSDGDAGAGAQSGVQGSATQGPTPAEAG